MSDLISYVLSAVINKIIEDVYSLIKEEFLLIYGVKEEVEKLRSNLSAIEAVLKDAEERQLEEYRVRHWLGKLKDVAYDAEDTLDTFATEASLWKRKAQVGTFWPPFSFNKASYQSRAAHKIKEISTDLNRIAEEIRDLNLENEFDNGRSKNYPHTDSFVDPADVFGREDDRERILELLLSYEYDKAGDISVIPIIGMGGLGKTTLAQLIFNDERVKKHFEFRMWVCVTVDFDLKRILKEMIEYHSKNKYDIILSSSLLESYLEFLRGKRFLLVLDDVWTEDYADWEPIQKLLKQGDKGSRVLVTSRTTKVSNIMGTQPPYYLQDLPEDQCWSLFKKIAFKNDNLTGGVGKYLEDIARQNVGKCQGLPLAVKAMGGLLRGAVDVKTWQSILSSSMWMLKGNTLPVLKLSYNRLPSYLKQCFAYCSIFPKGYVFDKEELVKLWMAQGFIISKGQVRAEKIGIEYFEELFANSFFQISDSKERYKMHDLIHDLAQSISSPYCCQVKDNKSCSYSKNSRHVSLLCQDVEKPALKIVDDSKNLRTLLLPSEYLKSFGVALDKMFLTLKHLRTLDLSSSILFKLPNSIEELKLLRYLDLSRTEIEVLPNSICNLYNLQTLKLLGCLWLFKLPEDLGKLVNLRHLELDDMFWFKCTILPARMGNLTSLHDLHAFPVGCESGHRIDELKEMEYLTGTLHISKLETAVNVKDAKLNEKDSLQKVVYEWSNRDVNPHDEMAEERVLKDLQPHSNLKELQICHYKGTGFPPWMTGGVLPNLVSVSLDHCTKCKNLSLGKLPKLEKLFIKGMQELEEFLDVQCPSLDALTISNCPKLRKLPDLLPSLTDLKIKKCDSLKVLSLTASLKNVSLNDNLLLEDWDEVSVPDVQGQPSLIYFSRLKVSHCPKLQALPQKFSCNKLEISGCELLSILPGEGLSQRLQHLALDTCHVGTLVKAIPNTNTSSLCSLVISNISNLASLPKLPLLPGLKALYISDCKELLSLGAEEGSLQNSTSLATLSVRGCPKLETLPHEGLPTSLECLIIGSCFSLQSLGARETLKNLTSLKDLYVEECPLLKSLPKDGLPASLQHLCIQGCPLLTEECREENEGGAEWPKIMHIPDLEIDSPRIEFEGKDGASRNTVRLSNSDRLNSSLQYPKADILGAEAGEISNPSNNLHPTLHYP